jgi:hypothetical protein
MRLLWLRSVILASVVFPLPAAEPVVRPQPAREVWRLHRVCPGEGGCVFGDWTSRGPVTVHEKRDAGSPVVFRLRKGDKVTGLRSTLLSLKTGACRTTAAIVGTSEKELKDIAIPKGTRLWSFYYKGEGSIVVGIGDTWTAADRVSVCCALETIECSEEPEYELWFEVRTAEGKTGWTKDSDQLRGMSQYDE